MWFQARALISKLTEEKNSVIQQNNKLQQELVRTYLCIHRLRGFFPPEKCVMSLWLVINWANIRNESAWPWHWYLHTRLLIEPINYVWCSSPSFTRKLQKAQLVESPHARRMFRRVKISYGFDIWCLEYYNTCHFLLILKLCWGLITCDSSS